MLAPLVAAALVLAPPAQPRLEPTDEGALYDPPANDPQFEPVEIAPPPPREPPAPAPAPAPTEPLPTPPVLDLPPPPPPPTGAGRLVGGSLSLALGLAAASVVIVEGARPDGNPQFVASTFIPLGLTGIGVGTYLLVRGARARANFNEWRAYTEHETLPSGEGLLVGGVMSMVIGGVSLVAASVQAREPDALSRPLAPTLFALGAVGVGVGVGGLTGGLLRRSRYRAWRQSTFLSALPVIAPTRGGLKLGLVGRF